MQAPSTLKLTAGFCRRSDARSAIAAPIEPPTTAMRLAGTPAREERADLVDDLRG